jgi:hypothetical protein
LERELESLRIQQVMNAVWHPGDKQRW